MKFDDLILSIFNALMSFYVFTNGKSDASGIFGGTVLAVASVCYLIDFIISIIHSRKAKREYEALNELRLRENDNHSN